MTARIDAAIDGGNLFGLVLLAFLAVMREGFETVLFFSALVYSGQGGSAPGADGGAGGLLVSVVLVWGCCAPPARWRWPLLPLDRPAHHHHRSRLALVRRQHVAGSGRHHLLDHAGLQHQPHPRRSGVFGTFLRALFGYNASPAGLQLLTWACYLIIFVTLWHRSYRPQGSAARPGAEPGITLCSGAAHRQAPQLSRRFGTLMNDNNKSKLRCWAPALPV